MCKSYDFCEQVATIIVLKSSSYFLVSCVYAFCRVDGFFPVIKYHRSCGKRAAVNLYLRRGDCDPNVRSNFDLVEDRKTVYHYHYMVLFYHDDCDKRLLHMGATTYHLSEAPATVLQ